MADYQYKGVGRDGRAVDGKISAANDGDLRMALRSQGIRPTSIKKTAEIKAASMFSIGGGVPLQKLVVFTRQFQVLINSGVPLVQALEILTEQEDHRHFKAVMKTVREKVSGGAYFWETLNGYPKIFPKLYVALVRAGEASGALEGVLRRLSRYLEDTERLRRLVKGALTYPAIVISVAVGVVTLLLTFVIPKFEALLVTNGAELPEFTQLVLTISHFLGDNMIYLLPGLTLVGFVSIRYFSSPAGRRVMDYGLFKFPVFGPIMQKSGVARFSRTMQTLLTSGVNILDAIDICKATVDNVVIEDAVSKIRGEVEQGKTLGATVLKVKVFPQMASQMISVGEATGNLDKMLEKVADFYEAEVEVAVGNMAKLIEPALMVVLGGVIGAIMIAMYLPIFKMADAIKS